MGRRSFLKKAAFAGGGFALLFTLDTRSSRAAEGEAPESHQDATTLNAFVRIAPNNTVAVYSKGPEIGQGIKTAFGLIIVEQAPLNPKVYGSQSAGGSTSIPRGWDQLRQAGATVRAMPIGAAAKQWNVPATECTASNSVVTHKPTGRTLTYGAVATAAENQVQGGVIDGLSTAMGLEIGRAPHPSRPCEGWDVCGSSSYIPGTPNRSSF